MTIKTYKILGLSLLYPEADMWAEGEQWFALLKAESLLPKKSLKALEVLYTQRQEDSGDAKRMLEAQSRYVELFDRSRTHSLHLLEHVYGESRERGQAMVDLVQTYQDVGLFLVPGEMPDYLPLFLEYLSQCSAKEAKKTLGEVIDIIGALGARLEHADSPYAVIFDALKTLSKVKPKIQDIEKLLKNQPQPIETLEQLDEEWQEKEAFAKDDCGSCGTLSHFNEMLKESHNPSPTLPRQGDDS